MLAGIFTAVMVRLESTPMQLESVTPLATLSTTYVLGRLSEGKIKLDYLTERFFDER